MSSGGTLYLLVGKEEYLKKEFIRELRNKLAEAPPEGALEYREFHASESPLSHLESFIGDALLFSGKKCAVLWGVDELEAEEKDRLFSLVSALPAATAVILAAEQGTAKKDKFLVRLAALARTLSFHAPFENDFPSFVQSRAKKRGLTMDSEAVFFLLDAAGRQVAEIDAAIEKLSIYVHPRTAVTRDDAEALIGRALSPDAFGLAELLLNRKAKAALRGIEAILREGGKGYEILGLLVSQFERLKKTADLIEEGRSAEEIGAALKIHPYYLQKTLSQARNMPAKRREHLFRHLAECDEAMKTGRLNETLALERYVLEVCLN